MTRQVRLWQATVGLLVITTLAYLTSLGGAFVYDDFDYVVTNPVVVQQPTDLRAIFTTSYPSNHPEQKLYRPLVTLSYVVDRAVWGIPNPPGARPNRFHITNLLWHCAVVLALFVLGQRLSGAAGTGSVNVSTVLGAALFAVHPLTTESVVWVVGRAEVMAACFSLVSLIGYVGWLRTKFRPWPWLALTGVGYALAVLCKENAFVLPALAALIQWRYRLGSDATRKQSVLVWAGFAIVAFTYLGWRQYLFTGITMQEQAYAGITGTATRVLVASKVLMRYLLLVFVPYRQSVFHDVRVEYAIGGSCLSFLLVATGWLVWRRRKFPNVCFGWLWFFIALLPVSNLVFPIGAVMAERFLYVPLIGWALALMSALESSVGKFSRWLTMVLLVVLAHNAVRTAWRGLDWRDERQLWASAAQVYPDSFIVQAQLGLACASVSDRVDAQRHLTRALELMQSQPVAYREKFEPRIREALRTLTSAGQIPVPSPELESIHKIARENRLDEAAGKYAAYLDAHPGDIGAQRALVDCYLRLRTFEDAARVLRSLIARDPQNALYHAKLGFALSHLGETETARREYNAALALTPDDALTWANLGSLEMREQNLDDATMCFEHAVNIQPRVDEFRLNLAVCYFQQGRTQRAREQAAAILQHDPANTEARKLLQSLAGK